jgi:tetratricopeptide (TPR) repeat protein
LIIEANSIKFARTVLNFKHRDKMLTKKKKLSKKEIKEDKLVEFYYKAQSYFDENKNRIIIYAGVLIAIVGAIYLYLNYRSEQNNEAGKYLGQVMDVYDMGSYLEAIEGKQGTNLIGLKKIVQDYGSTPNGETAKIYLADCYSNLGQEDEALKYYKEYDGDIDIFKAASFAGQAGILSYNNQYKEAAELYLKASKVSKNDIQDTEYMYQAGINFFQAGEKDEAKELFQTIKNDSKNTSYFSKIDKYLSQLN